VPMRVSTCSAGFATKAGGSYDVGVALASIALTSSAAATSAAAPRRDRIPMSYSIAVTSCGRRLFSFAYRGPRYLNIPTGLLGVGATREHSPYVFLGPADYVSHEGDRPMAITWRLRQPMPTEVYQASTVAMA
jgi:hypothetical protein